MSEPARLTSLSVDPAPQGSPGARLSGEAARLAAALAAHLSTLGLPETQGLVSFLSSQNPGATAAAPGDPLQRLIEGAGFTPLERELVLLAGLSEEHEGYGVILRRLHPAGEPFPTAGMAAQLLCKESDDRRRLAELLHRGAAARSGVLRLRGEGPLFERGVSLGEGLWAALQGLDAWPAELRPSRQGSAVLPQVEGLWPESFTTRPLNALAKGKPAAILVLCEQEELALSFVLEIVRRAGGVAAVLGPEALAADRFALLSAHCLARGRVPIITLAGEQTGDAPPHTPPQWEHPCPLLLIGRPGAQLPPLRTPIIDVQLPGASMQARQQLWAALLPELAAEAPRLASSYSVGPMTAQRVVADVLYRSALEDRPPQIADVVDSVRLRSQVNLPGGVYRVQPKASWDHLVLHPDKEEQLRDAIGRLQHRGQVIERWGFLRDRPGARGVRIMLSGPPGTGKTLAAEVLAREIGVDMLVVDLSRVVSKWLGETEKNLARVFDVAEGIQAVLVFDEADALFGKRTEVSDAHDRYANLETAYLLARLERFDGLTVLTTNLRQNIDPAFMRRMEFAVDFHEPSERERRLIWRCHVPEAVPCTEDVDFHELAALFPLVGGHIRNAAVAAGFLAAARGQRLSREHLIRAIWREYEKSGRAFPGDPSGRTGLQGGTR